MSLSATSLLERCQVDKVLLMSFHPCFLGVPDQHLSSSKTVFESCRCVQLHAIAAHVLL